VRAAVAGAVVDGDDWTTVVVAGAGSESGSKTPASARPLNGIATASAPIIAARRFELLRSPFMLGSQA
jgi:hypothetical protein